MNLSKIVLMGISTLFLWACNEDTLNNAVGTVNADTDIKNSKAEEEIANDMIIQYYEFATAVHQDVYNNNFTDENKQDYVEITTEFLNYINSIEPASLDFENKMLSDYLWDFDYSATKYAENTLDYLTNQDSVYRNMAEDLYYDVLADMELLNSILPEE